MKYIIGLILVAVVIGIIMHRFNRDRIQATSSAPRDIYGFSLTGINGTPMPMSEYRGQIILIVNVASRCGLTPQYAELEALYQKYRKQGFVVLGVPANNFLSQEPGTNEEIQAFCKTTYDVTFPMSQKISVKGGDIHSLYRYLTTQTEPSNLRGAIKWNFAKFLVDQNGVVVARYSPTESPLAKKITDDIDQLVAKKKL